MVDTQDIAVLRTALASLPSQCRYHGDRTAPDDYGHLYGRTACCETGLPAQQRKLATEVLDRLARRPQAPAG
jgi:hypothetical protein